jgi:hypothetical protein
MFLWYRTFLNKLSFIYLFGISYLLNVIVLLYLLENFIYIYDIKIIKLTVIIIHNTGNQAHALNVLSPLVLYKGLVARPTHFVEGPWLS